MTKILTIDDEAAVAERIVGILESNDYQARSATKWTDALDAIAHGQPDLILLDLEMPIIHGATLLDFIREEGYDMPVIAVSHIDEESAIQALLNRGAQGIVEKPFSASRLIEEIERVLDKAEPESPTTATAEPASTDAPPAESSASETEEKPLEPPPADGSIEPPRDAKPPRTKMTRRKKIALITILLIYLICGGFIAAMYLTEEVPAFVDRMLRYW